MFCYKGSKLESDLNDLKKEYKKTDYEKAIEPYQIRIKKLEKNIYSNSRYGKLIFSW